MREPHRMTAVQSPMIPIIAGLIRACPGTISLGQGVVSFGPPPEATASLASFPGDAEDHRYGAVEGTDALLDALRAKLAADNAIRPDQASRVVVTAGGNMAFMNAILAVTDPGDEVILQAPYYFNHDMAIAMAGCRTIPVATDAGHQLRPDAIRRAITPRTRAVVTISPNNPTGAVYPEASLREVNALCAERGVYHITDEAYEYFTYGAVGSMPCSAAHTISLFSMSKTFGMASWRIGYMVIPARLFESINKIQDTILICPPLVSQHVALAALGVGSAYCRAKVAALAPVRDVVLAALARVADMCTVPRPDGAFYCLVRVHARLDPLSVVERLIRDHQVAAVPGTAFGLDGCYLRVSYGALDAHTVEEGIERLVGGLRAVVRDAP
jgi:aspartate/methionine/tyrosine aminotransferase